MKRFEIVEHDARELTTCACEHGSHHDGHCKARVVRHGVALPCPCKECFCFACFLRQRREQQAG
jgi:hypothetical protein